MKWLVGAQGRAPVLASQFLLWAHSVRPYHSNSVQEELQECGRRHPSAPTPDYHSQSGRYTI